jgi:hypothetical protein
MRRMKLKKNPNKLRTNMEAKKPPTSREVFPDGIIRHTTSPHFETIKPDGFVLAPTAGGELCLNFYNDSLHVPSETVIFHPEDPHAIRIEVGPSDVRPVRENKVCLVLSRGLTANLLQLLHEYAKNVEADSNASAHN